MSFAITYKQLIVPQDSGMGAMIVFPGLASPALLWCGLTETGSLLGMAPWCWLLGSPGTEQTDRLWFSATPEDLSAANRAIWLFFWWNCSHGSPGTSVSPPLEGLQLALLPVLRTAWLLPCVKTWDIRATACGVWEQCHTSPAKPALPCGNKRRKLIKMACHILCPCSFFLPKHLGNWRKPVWSTCKSSEQGWGLEVVALPFHVSTWTHTLGKVLQHILNLQRQMLDLDLEHVGYSSAKG